MKMRSGFFLVRIGSSGGVVVGVLTDSRTSYRAAKLLINGGINSLPTPSNHLTKFCTKYCH